LDHQTQVQDTCYFVFLVQNQEIITMAEASNEDNEVTNVNITSEHVTETKTVGTNVKAVLEKLSEFLTENNLEKQITDETKNILKKNEGKNEEINQKKETHRHKVYEIHEAY
jgi:signal recognition particle GTPase